jgi:HEAT repeat protein
MRQLNQIQEEPVEVRLNAAAAPVGLSFDELVRTLSAGKLADRVEAARTLPRFGAAATEPLGASLRDKELRVRLAAATSLGEIGDERAIQPLVAAMRELFPGSSPRRYRTVGMLAAITFPLAGLLAAASRLAELGVSQTVITAAFAAVVVLIAANGKKAYRILGTLLSDSGYDGGNPCLVFSRALAQIAERCPAPELREALPTLKEIAADGLQHNLRTRADSRRAIRRIEALTAQLEVLPVTASPPTARADELPGASEAPRGLEEE